jgi:hypothetical protein
VAGGVLFQFFWYIQMDMNNKLVLGASLTAVTVMMVFSPVLADEFSGFSSIVQINDKNIGAIINSDDLIEESGAYGFGVVTSVGLEGILITATHGGVLDSAAQTDASDASFHNHYVSVQDSKVDGSGLCPTMEVKDISWDEPGDVTVLDDAAVFDGPTEFKSTHSLTGDEVTFSNLGPVGAVVSFTITPVDGAGNFSLDPIVAVCIDAVGDAEPLVDKSITKQP